MSFWSLKTCEGDGYIYVVIEHQSTPDAHMAFRLMRYAHAAMQRHLDAGHKTLPLVSRVESHLLLALKARIPFAFVGWRV